MPDHVPILAADAVDSIFRYMPVRVIACVISHDSEFLVCNDLYPSDMEACGSFRVAKLSRMRLTNCR
jgi:hypothetical protein